MNTPVLTPRQEQIVALLAEGLTLLEIGRRLYITRATVRTHLSAAFAATGTHCQPALVAFALRHGLIA